MDNKRYEIRLAIAKSAPYRRSVDRSGMGSQALIQSSEKFLSRLLLCLL